MKLVNENLFEFKKGLEPVDSLGMGRRKLIKDWLDSMDVHDYIINNDLTIDVNDQVRLEYNNLKNIPEYINFNEIDGDFWINNNELTSLRGCPRIVKGSFSCSQNFLTSLEDAPKEAHWNFYCRCNSKKFSVDEVLTVCDVKGDIYVNDNIDIINEFQKGLDPVESLGMSRRKMIKDWLKLMRIIDYNINDDYTIDSDWIYLNNRNLTEFPEFIQFGKIKNSFDCNSNNLVSLRGCPKIVGRNFYCNHNKVKFTEDDVRKVCEVGGNIHA